MGYTHRYLARICIEAETPLAVGSGEKGLNTDRLVAKDANGLPYIPGTSLTGVLRHSFGDAKWVADIFGSGGTDGKGSRLLVSAAFLIGADGKTVMEGLQNINLNDGYYSYFSRLPERDHVRINDKGAADSENHGKFDEELVHKGTRFVFKVELIANHTEQDKAYWKEILASFSSPAYRIGGGTRKGFGKLKILSKHSSAISLDLTNPLDLKTYLQKSGSLNDSIPTWKPLQVVEKKELDGWKDYSLTLKAKDFFTFSEGIGDFQADNIPKKERFFDWSNQKPVLTEKAFTLIPATSIKGALSHRVAYHYNLAKEHLIGKDTKGLESEMDVERFTANIIKDFDLEGKSYASDSVEWERLKERIESLSLEGNKDWEEFQANLKDEVRANKGFTDPVGENNEAVKNLFGYAKNTEEYRDGLRGRVLIEDAYLPNDQIKEKVFNHTSIDRFTSGTIDGALFQEKVSYAKKEIEIKIWVEEEAWKEDKAIKEAFERSLEDLKTGRLALGGSTTKGHGMFTTSKN